MSKIKICYIEKRINETLENVRHKLINTLSIDDENNINKVYDSIHADLEYIRIIIEEYKKN